MNKAKSLKFKDVIRLLGNDFKLKKTIIKRIILCTFIGLLMSLFYSIANSKENDISNLVAIIISIISLDLKLIHEMENWNCYE